MRCLCDKNGTETIGGDAVAPALTTPRSKELDEVHLAICNLQRTIMFTMPHQVQITPAHVAGYQCRNLTATLIQGHHMVCIPYLVTEVGIVQLQDIAVIK